MSRNDSILYTATSSASLTTARTHEVREKKEATKQTRLDKQHKLKPSADIIGKILDGERALVIKEIADLPIKMETSEENVKEVLMALQRNLNFIDRMRTKVNLALKDIT